MENISGVSQYDYFKQSELSEEAHIKLIQHAKSINIDFFSTPSHKTDVDFLQSINIQAFKIGADDATNIPLIKYIAATQKPVFLSTGMCYLEEVIESINAIKEEGNNQIVIFHTISNYPAHPQDLNLNVITTLKNSFPDCVIGFSDHSIGINAAIVAFSLGAKVIEKHFTLDKNAPGPDHMLSITPDELKQLSQTLHQIKLMYGSPEKKPYGTEIKNRILNRKSIVAIKDIQPGETFSPHNIDIKRPGGGIHPKLIYNIYNKKAKRYIKADELIKTSDF